MFSGFVVEFLAFAAATRPAIGAVLAAEFARAGMPGVAGWLDDHRRPGDLCTATITKNDTFNPGHGYLLFQSISSYGFY
jgi:hypothetical protein